MNKTQIQSSVSELFETIVSLDIFEFNIVLIWSSFAFTKINYLCICEILRTLTH